LLGIIAFEQSRESSPIRKLRPPVKNIHPARDEFSGRMSADQARRYGVRLDDHAIGRRRDNAKIRIRKDVKIIAIGGDGVVERRVRRGLSHSHFLYVPPFG
jgi:hypothetical protein